MSGAFSVSALEMAVSGGCPNPSVSECTSMPLSGAPKLTDLPNELFIHIFTYLDARSVLYLSTTCKRLHALTSDPINWSSILWRANNRIDDIDGLKLALRLSKGVLKHLSVFCCSGWHLSKCIDQILSCRYVRSISLRVMSRTENQVVKLLSLPGLTYLHLDEVSVSLLKSIVRVGHQLKTLSLSLSLQDSSIYHHTNVWSKAGYIPPDLRIEHKRYRLDIEAILSLPPSVNHSASLSVYHQEINPTHPYLQFQFTPVPTLAVTQPMELIPIADTPGSKEFSAASYNCYHKGIKGNIDLRDILCDTLTVLQLSGASGLTSDMLVELTGALPNLVHLDLSRCDNVLSDLSGLAAVSTSCSKLKVLNLLGIERAESLEKLWKILETIVNLRFLSVQASLILEESDPILIMPSLTAIKIRGSYLSRNTELILTFLTQMSSLEIVRLEYLPPVNVFHGFSRLLHASANLTHLYISKRPGNKLTLPSDPSCYANLEHFHLDCPDFVFRDDLASALAQSKKLCVLVLRISHLDIRKIINIVKFSKLLSFFYVCVTSAQGLNYTGTWSSGKTKIFVKFLRETAKKEGRTIEFRMRVGHWDWYPAVRTGYLEVVNSCRTYS